MLGFCEGIIFLDTERVRGGMIADNVSLTNVCPFHFFKAQIPKNQEKHESKVKVVDSEKRYIVLKAQDI